MCAAAAKVAILKLCCSNEARSVYLYCMFVTVALIDSFSHRPHIKCVFILPSPSTIRMNFIYLAVCVG